jgi:multidrug resistance efflux pump
VRDWPDLATLLSRRPFLVATVVLLVVLPVLALLPYLRSMVSRNAVVTAFVYTAHAPISGRLVKAPARPGQVVSEGSAAGWIEDPRADDDLVSQLHARADAQRMLIGELDDESRRLTELAASDAAGRHGYRDALDRDLDQQLERLRHEVKSSEARLVELRNDAARAASLHRDGVVPESDLESATAELEALEASRDAQHSEIERIEAARAELGSGRIIGGQIDGAVQIEQALEQLHLARVAFDRLRVEAKAELDAVSARLESAEARFGRVQRAPIEVPDGVVVWQVLAVPGQFVEGGAPLFSFVDCHSLLLDMRLDDSVLSLADTGHAMHFRVFGSRSWHEGKVAMVRGSGAVMGTDAVATAVSRRSRDGQVLAAIPAEDQLGDAEAFCGIGRKAYARVDGIGIFSEFARRWFL